VAKVKGVNCDSCGKVPDQTTRTKRSTRFEGAAANGSDTEDLCAECVVIPEGVNYKEFKARGSKTAASNGSGDVTQVPDAPAPAPAAATA